MAKTWLGRPGQASVTSLQCPSNYPSEPCGIRPGWKTPREKRESHKYRQKPIFFLRQRGRKSGEPELPVHQAGSAVKGPRGPVVGLCGSWTLPSANATSPWQTWGSSQENTPTSSHLKQHQQQRPPHESRGLRPWWNTARMRRFGLSFWPSSYPMRTAKRIKDTLGSSMSSFCAPISFVRKALKGCVMHHWIRNGLKGCLEKKYPLAGFARPLTAKHLKSRRERFQTWDQMRGWLCSSCWQFLLKYWKWLFFNTFWDGDWKSVCIKACILKRHFVILS